MYKYIRNTSLKILLWSGCVLMLVIAIGSSIALLGHKYSTQLFSTKKVTELTPDSVSRLCLDMEEMVEAIFSNQGHQLPEEMVFHRYSDNAECRDFDSQTVFVCISPLGCWSCVRTIQQHLYDLKEDYPFCYLIYDKYSNQSEIFLKFLDIPEDQVYSMTSTLGLPVEESNRVFLFTMDKNSLITNVFTPSRYSKDMTEAYLNTIFTN